MSQQTQILRHLESGGKLSQLAALREFGCMRLAAVIHRLRRKGYRITTDERHQRGKRFAVYRLESDEDE